MSENAFNIIQGKFIRGAAFSKEDQAIYLIEANHNLFKLAVVPDLQAQIMRVDGADYLQQAKVVSVIEHEPVAHRIMKGDTDYQFASRSYSILTDAGTCKLIVASENIDVLPNLGLTCLAHVGYPPDDAKRLEDTIDG